MTAPKLCKDCVHLSDLGDWCARPIVAFDLVYGHHSRPLNRDARAERQAAPEADICGPTGRYWEAKEQPKPATVEPTAKPAKKGGRK